MGKGLRKLLRDALWGRAGLWQRRSSVSSLGRGDVGGKTPELLDKYSKTLRRNLLATGKYAVKKANRCIWLQSSEKALGTNVFRLGSSRRVRPFDASGRNRFGGRTRSSRQRAFC